jgi:uncharacterized protein (DUF2147 family)
MRYKRTALHAMALAAAIASAASARADNSATGVWIDHTGRGAVEITDCNGKLCGHVAWVEDTKNSGQCGKQIIGDVSPVGKNKWDNGWIYDPDSDKTYDVELTPTGSDTLKVVGYAGTKWLSKSFTWKRAPADLQKCNGTGERAASTTDPKAPAASTEAAGAPDRNVKPDVASRGADNDEPAAAAKADTNAKPKANDTAKAGEAPEDDMASDEPRGKDRPIVSRLMERLEAGDTPVKVTRRGGTCKMTVPYVDMVISVPCED